ncbi:uncharacterized protein SCHCODRAFT_02645610 [Schizophyllum commune H4-8]|uniref:uncharacterized protein n=1 Tax=Schizophyllum commune (strain H4-8 / FGSC 9210) TaxID=578458 RepID=UPI0021601AEE|nr:uncharacterized protein SCHCODRAFT_02645610 [Schizophyllum commune H4-8]KAI5884858.1 hypothetical protein SCHCODRAFT_02645610 [Schizophyllum commune H4-8]
MFAHVSMQAELEMLGVSFAPELGGYGLIMIVRAGNKNTFVRMDTPFELALRTYTLPELL